MTTIRKWTLLCCVAALFAVAAFSPAARADELRVRDKTALEGNRGRGGHRGGRRHHGGGSGWAWAGLGAAIGMGILSAVTDDGPRYAYAEPAPSYQVVYPPATQYYYQAPAYPVQPGYSYVQPNYVRPNYGQTYVVPAQPAPPPCNVCP